MKSWLILSAIGAGISVWSLVASLNNPVFLFLLADGLILFLGGIGAFINGGIK